MPHGWDPYNWSLMDHTWHDYHMSGQGATSAAHRGDILMGFGWNWWPVSPCNSDLTRSCSHMDSSEPLIYWGGWRPWFLILSPLAYVMCCWWVRNSCTTLAETKHVETHWDVYFMFTTYQLVQDFATIQSLNLFFCVVFLILWISHSVQLNSYRTWIFPISLRNARSSCPGIHPWIHGPWGPLVAPGTLVRSAWAWDLRGFHSPNWHRDSTASSTDKNRGYTMIYWWNQAEVALTWLVW